ncbi:hypothetical protein [Sulfuritalea hydrogenivorans]|jgi:hypothetical protein|uniref:DUF309 domain-containing protein n=1 Tax=Sulfuritalea hydrogenivorans sk43H TaxID=1223802 RepID=W0SER5_9PROT|nr:hypothetical protein [Sulfuritalea hydrogenivorans]MDK9715175.1 hypothetical protein [Sulfuritalea sp.]BAO28238.1 hypothetical protein SUTH_00424 [Sulfuritalea hydrogenivorans sk43H]
MILDLATPKELPAPDRGVLSQLDWRDVAVMWNSNDLGALHDWLNERWSRLIRNSLLGTRDPEAEFLQGLAFATLALFFTQNQNQDGALLLIDDAQMALAKYRPRFLGVNVEPILGGLQELRPLLVGLAPDADCPLYPFVYPKFEYTT